MDARERVLNALRRRGSLDRLPFEISWGSFTPLLMKTYREKTGSTLPPEEYFDYDTRFVLPDPTRLRTDFSVFFDGLDERVHFDEWGVGSVPTLYEIPDYKYHPLEKMGSAAEIDAFPWPDLGDNYRYVKAAENVKVYHDRGYAVCGEMYQTLFESAWLMRGMETFMTDFYLEPEIAHAICERITDIRIRQAREFTKTGVDIIRLGDDIVTQQGRMMSAETYREFFQPRIRRIVSAAKAVNPEVIIFMHSCGHVEEVIDALIEAGVEVLNPVQPECNDLRRIKEKYGDRLSFWGGIGVQSVLPHGTPDDVRRAVTETKEFLGRDGGLLLAPAHILDPAVPWENVLAFVEAARRLN
ncbi:MAG: uroporphyrinogen decarboxylase family protein [Kiritimatiellales bacterium]